MDIQHVIKELAKQADIAKKELINQRQTFIKFNKKDPVPSYLQENLTLPEIFSSICEMLVRIDQKLDNS